MKTCLICQTPDESGALETCPNCGEASWSEPAPAAEEPAPPAPAPKSRKAGAK